MAGVAGKSILGSLWDKVKKAVNAHKNDETKYDGGGSLPAGIENGVAQLTECKFDLIKPGKENAGKPFFYAAGVIVSPEVHTDGTPLAGRRTSIMEVMFDTPTRTRKDVEAHVEWVMNMMRCLGADTSTLSSPDDLEATAAALKEAAPHFTFRTWKGEMQKVGPYANKEPRVQESWGKAIEWNAEGAAPSGASSEPSGGVEDDTPPQPEEEEQGEDEPDVDALVEAEDGEKLTELALSLGISKKAVEGAEDWAAVGQLIKDKQSPSEGEKEDSGEDQSSDEPADPEPGEVYKYQLLDAKGKPVLDPKTKKPRKPVDVEVVKVDTKTGTVTLKDLDTKKAITGTDPKTALKVPFSQLIAE